MEKDKDQFLKAKCFTWTKDTDDLFDYETKELKEFRVNIYNWCALVSTATNIVALDNMSDIKSLCCKSKSNKVLAEICKNKAQGYFFQNPFFAKNFREFHKENLEKLWKIIPKSKARDIKEGDIIKLGRVILKLDKINLKETVQDIDFMPSNNYLKINLTQYNKFPNPQNLTETFSYINEDKNYTEYFLNSSISNICSCRICFKNDSGIDNPLLTPCKCSGSMAYIHYECLKQCIEGKYTKRECENYIIYFWKAYNCEICLAEYPKHIKYKQFVYHLIDIATVFEEYIIVDYIVYDEGKDTYNRKGILIMNLEENNEITIGRAHSNVLKLKDISISRNHCAFVKEKGKVLLYDKGSKFGSKVYVDSPISINYVKENISFEAGKNLLNFEILYNRSFLSYIFPSCCCKIKNQEEEVLIDELNKEIMNTQLKAFNKPKALIQDYVINLDKIIKSSEFQSNISFT